MSCCEVNGNARTLCGNCRAEVGAALHNNREQKSTMKSNLVPGLAGAFLGALIGVVLWVLLVKLDRSSVIHIMGAFIEVCALRGYEKFGGSLDLKGWIGSLIIVVVSIYFADRLATAWLAYDALKGMGWSFSECFWQLSSGIIDMYPRNLAVIYGVAAVFGISWIIRAFRTSRG